MHFLLTNCDKFDSLSVDINVLLKLFEKIMFPFAFSVKSISKLTSSCHFMFLYLGISCKISIWIYHVVGNAPCQYALVTSYPAFPPWLIPLDVSPNQWRFPPWRLPPWPIPPPRSKFLAHSPLAFSPHRLIPSTHSLFPHWWVLLLVLIIVGQNRKSV